MLNSATVKKGKSKSYADLCYVTSYKVSNFLTSNDLLYRTETLYFDYLVLLSFCS